jgi:hypothetical protein
MIERKTLYRRFDTLVCARKARIHDRLSTIRSLMSFSLIWFSTAINREVVVLVRHDVLHPTNMVHIL